MRKITMIVVHCSAVRPNQTSSAKQIDEWHRKDNHWRKIGYHIVIRRDGTEETGRRLEEVGAHVLNHNRHSIGICYEGGLDSNGDYADTRTPEQVKKLREVIMRLHAYFPDAVIVGHRDLTHDRECPCFDAVSEYWDLQPR